MLRVEAVLKGPRTELGRDDARYPDMLRAIDQPPKRLYVIGDCAALRPGLAIVGARKATPYGTGCAQRFARIAAEQGVCIISGGARGCDSEAHCAALAAGAPTVVFLGGGCDCLYPPEHAGLFQQVIDAGGAVVSEHPWGFKPLPYTFRARNRLIAGLAEAVLIVEAGLPSGTFTTADDALSQGKEVLVVPGAITSQMSRGANRLLYQGAIPVVDDESFEDVLFSLFSVLKRPPAGGGDEQAGSDDPVVAAALAAPTSTDELFELAVREHGAERAMAAMNESLAVAEAAGLIARHPDGRWGPVVAA